MGEVVEMLRVDRRGRVLIPSRVRRELGIGRAVLMRVQGGKIVLEPVRDPVDDLRKLVTGGPESVASELRGLRRGAEGEGVGEVRRRWGGDSSRRT